MKTKHEIKFVTTESKTRLTAGKTCYQGQLQHNNVLTQKETRRWFAKYCSEPESRTTRYIDALGEFIVAIRTSPTSFAATAESESCSG